MNAHTPGPWTREVYSDNSVQVCDVTGNDICTMGGNTNDGSNARLIAAAPELLDVARMARDMISTERQSFADCNVVPELTEGDDPDNFISIGGALFEQHDADVVADYDRALARIDAAIAKTTGAAS